MSENAFSVDHPQNQYPVDGSQRKVDEACKEREAALGRALEGWEREIVQAFLTNERLKATTPEERTSITNFETVIS